jgi:hypothetical protein
LTREIAMTDQQNTQGRSMGGEASSAASELKARASESYSAAKEEVSHRAEGAKSSIADELSGVAQALRNASGEMRDNSTSRRAVGWVADSLNDASQAIRNRETSQLMNDIGGFAKRNPALFLGGAALVGFAISRFAKASAHRSSQSYGGSQSWMASDGDTGRSTAGGMRTGPMGESGQGGQGGQGGQSGQSGTSGGSFGGVGDENTAFGDSNFNQAGNVSKGVAP